MVMDEDKRRRSEVKGAFNHLTGIHRGVIDCSSLLPLIPNQRIFSIKEEDMKLFDLAVRDLGVQSVRRQNRLRLHRQPRAVTRHIVRRSRRAYPFSSEIADTLSVLVSMYALFTGLRGGVQSS